MPSIALTGGQSECSEVVSEKPVLIAVAAVLAGFNLRVSIASIPPLLSSLERHPGVSPPAALALTGLPFLCFAVAALAGPLLLRRLGTETALLAVFAVIVLGTLVRAAGSTTMLLIGTAVAAGAISIGNVVLPVLIKAQFPRRMGVVIGLYTAALSLGAALAGSFTVPLARWLGWQRALAIWALPAAMALAAAALAKKLRRRHETGAVRTRVRPLLGDRLAWQVTVFFGLQAGLSWLPAILLADRYSPAAAGFLLGLFALGAVPTSLLTPVLASRLTDQRVLAGGCAVLEAMALGGLALFPGLAVFSVAIFAVGQGAAFSLAVSLIGLRSADAAGSAELSRMAQAIGYAIAAAGPLTAGLLHDASSSWAMPLGFLIVLCVPMAIAGLGAGRAEHTGAGAR